MKKILFLLSALLLTLSMTANGDPTDRHSALIGSSNPTPRSIMDVQMLSEKLYIRPGKYSYITVKYVLWNNSNKDYIDIDYGFPVDYQGGGKKYVNSGLTSDYYSESSYTIGWQDDYIKEIGFYLDGKALPSKASAESVLTKAQLPDRKNYPPGKEGQEEYDVDLEYRILESVYRRWFYTQITIKKGQIVTLEVRYAIRNSSVSGAYAAQLSSYGCDNELVYDLSPASHWGNGTTRDFYVQIDASDIALTTDYYEKTRYGNNIAIEGLPFTQNGDAFTYRTSNFSFKDSQPIHLRYRLMNGLDMTESLSRMIPVSEYNISATSEQKAYPVANLTDLNFATAWVATNGGIGEKVIIEFKKPTLIEGFILVNGYHKSESAYLENNRIKSIHINIKGVRGGEQFEDDPINENINFKGVEYQALYLERMRQHPDARYYNIAYPYSKYKATRIELEITGIYPGTKYNDTCISEIFLFQGK